MRVRTCLVFIACAAVAAAETAIVDDLVNRVTDSAASAANEVVADTTDAAADAAADAAKNAVQGAADATGNAVHKAANSTGNYVNSTLDSAGSKLDDEGSKAGSTPAAGFSAASSMHQSSIVIMTTLAIAGLALNFV